MKIIEKLTFIQDNHFGEWLKTRKEVDEEVSNEHKMWCVCKKLCTGLHEMNCKKFQNKVTNKTLKRLKHLLPKLIPLQQGD